MLTLEELKAICQILNILYWKLPVVDEEKLGEWLAAELMDKEIPVSWDNEQEIFVPSEKGERKWKLLKIQ